MEKFHQLRKQALNYYTTADHLTYITYNLLQEPKLIITIIENLEKASSKAMSALVYYAKYQKRIDPAQTPTINIMQKQFNLNQEVFTAIKEIKELTQKRKESSMEFVRKDKYVLFTDEHNLQTLDIKQIKGFIRKLRPLIDAVSAQK